MFVLNSEITIDDSEYSGNKLQFSGVHDISIKRSLHSYTDSAVIRVPSVAAIRNNNKQIVTGVTTGDQFSDGAKVTIKVGYNGSLVEEFRGFVKSRSLDMPLEIVCEGYIRQLRLNNVINENYSSTSVQQLLTAATQGTDIKLQVPVDIPLNNININNKSGAEVCDMILKATGGTVSLFFIQPDTLWCGLVYTPYAQNNDPFGTGQVSYRLGYNVVKDNSLKEQAQSNPAQVIYNNKQPDGEKLVATSSITTAKTKLKKLMVHVPSQQGLQNLAQEKEYRINYQGYEGSINAFLQPYALPGYSAQVIDASYPKRNGIYLIESTEVIFGQNGARRITEIGPCLGGWKDK